MVQPEKQVEELLLRLERDFDHLKQGLGLVGIKPCSWCGKFFQSTDGGALLVWGDELVCSACIPEWWPQRRAQLSEKDQNNLERKLVNWLRRHHHAKVVSQESEQPDNPLQEFRLTATCLECSGAGTIMGQRCAYCAGRGSVWVITSKKESVT